MKRSKGGIFFLGRNRIDFKSTRLTSFIETKNFEIPPPRLHSWIPLVPQVEASSVDRSIGSLPDEALENTKEPAMALFFSLGADPPCVVFNSTKL
jgi:hypothetical protein